MALRNMNVGPRATLFFAVILVIVALLGAMAVGQLSNLRAAEQDVETNWMAGVRWSGSMNSTALRLRLESLRASTASDKALRDDTLQNLPGYRKEFLDAVAHYGALINDEQERSYYQAIVTTAEAYTKQLDQLENMLRTGALEQAAVFINGTVRPLTNQLQAQILALRDFNDEGANQAGISAQATYMSSLWMIGGLIAATLLVTAVLAALLIRSITAPISAALSIAQRIAKKDLTETIVVEGKDEASRMLVALGQMQGNLRQTVSHLSDSSAQLASASEEMSAVTDEASRGMVRQNDEVNQAATAVTEMSAAVDEVARNAAGAAEASRETEGLARMGIDNVAQTLVAIEKLSANVGSTATQVQTLSTRTQDITKVVEVIRAIAEQTNLLALNAAIEAARAGEQGRGFAVVADEVRALAHRTQQSTQEIEQMIGAIQNDSVHAARAMQDSRQMADDSNAVAQKANSSLEQIAQAITVINERNLLIATASEEQAQVAREIDRNLTSIRDLSTQSAAGASQTATASAEVSRLAVGLSRVVGEFTV
ncbi:methyl-accepting chemotaxis protein [Pseudomonas sp. URIL14HWK12:I9]|nr:MULTISPECIES: methyl-accepting chemotaxis protein [unclassified Pseudomonas]PVZ19887.1 methyl-accepting chemotaxis protein [Pseudomonas sp. URIL14HWK12:I12]PVZ26953.1 methyl-accepting chemotaxis protein [Pseudomonas sp. URIL14HWK12:I10]PVZ37842.1 methyl-accepting chemotaxis protein [Pseudomonas sp. URIL14HWK12:I11]SNZ05449.1 methyl-accepting chemotaxis protein [Pseudomonas sp. URIL14HWK12:I9]